LLGRGHTSIVPLGAPVGAPVDFAGLAANDNRVVLTALIEFVWAATGMGIAIGLYPILRKFNPALALGSVAGRVVENVFVLVGALSLLVLLTVSKQAAGSAAFDVPRGQRLMARLALGFTRPKNPILGMELAGVVERVGKDVTLFKKGDAVFGFTGWRLGAYAEYACVPEKPRRSIAKDGMLAIRPANMTLQEAAAGVATGGATALRILRKANIRRGQKVLVYGASGSVGTYAVQLAKSFGAEVTGVCGTANVELVRSLGADHVIDYTQQDFAEGESYDVVFDAVDKLASSRGKRALKKNGVYLNVNSDSGSGGGGSPEDLVFLTDLIEHGKIRAVIDRCYPLDEIVDAHRYVEQGHKKGHVVVSVAKEG
jgi:NADPH:quinone reductase-like Zn-dependent oxidoreductase